MFLLSINVNVWEVHRMECHSVNVQHISAIPPRHEHQEEEEQFNSLFFLFSALFFATRTKVKKRDSVLRLRLQRRLLDAGREELPLTVGHRDLCPSTRTTNILPPTSERKLSTSLKSKERRSSSRRDERRDRTVLEEKCPQS